MKGTLLKLFVCGVLVFGISGCGEKELEKDGKKIEEILRVKVMNSFAYMMKVKMITKTKDYYTETLCVRIAMAISL